MLVLLLFNVRNQGSGLQSGFEIQTKTESDFCPKQSKKSVTAVSAGEILTLQHEDHEPCVMKVLKG